ncbi:MAG: hypothetical protein ACJ0OL_04965 [Dehalococcoidia bacterium]|jgi:glutaconate CoA-transferase subunit A|nr:hypothetical protein [Chloroflexota bacterium]|tara:strand:- start:525 stop:827 length:303 start_codon:yes stop_codon:yes gene_type:complete
MTKFLPIEEAVAKIHSGSLLAMSGNNHKSSMAITRELVRQNVGDLKLVFTPAGGINGDMLIGAGLVTAVETGSLTFGESGLAPNYRRVAKEGGIAAMDTT